MRCTGIFPFAIISVLYAANAGAVSIYHDMSGTHITWNDDVEIHRGANVHFNNIITNSSIILKNEGTLTGNVTVCSGCELYIRNRGQMNINFDDTASVVQLVGTQADINSIASNVAPDVLVRNANMLPMSDILGINHENIILENSSILFDVTTPVMATVRGNVDLYIDDISRFVGTPLLRDIGDAGRVSVIANLSNPLMAIHTYARDDTVYADMVRETDYSKILKDDTGAFINLVRYARPNDKLVRALDSATSMSELRHTMSRSTRINPINLMRPVRTISDFIDLYQNPAMPHSGVSTAGTVIYNSDFTIETIGGGVGAKITDSFGVKIDGYVGRIDVSDDINDFAAQLYGATFHTYYDNGELFGMMHVGATVAKFDTDFVYAGNNKIDTAPDGTNYYGGFSLGARMNADDKFVFAPIAGITISRASVSNQSDTDAHEYVGLNITTGAGDAHLKYEYGTQVRADTDGGVAAMTRMSVWSVADAAGGDVQIGVINNTQGTSYQAVISLRASF